MKSSVPGSAQWRSSNSSATTPRAGEPLEERAPGREQLRRAAGRCLADAEQREQRGLDPPALGLVRDVRAPRPRRSARASSPRRRSRAAAHATRTISPSAQNVIPSPYDGERPSCHHTCSTTPSTYLRNSHASRLLPMPAWPVIETSRTRFSRAVAWNRSLSRRSSASRPTNGASRRSSRPRPRRSATTRSARHAATGATLPLRTCSPAGSKAIAPSRRLLGRLADEHAARRGDGLEPRRRVHEVAGDHALVAGADRDRRLAGEHAAAGLDPRRRARGRPRPARARRGPPARRRPRARSGRPRRPSPRRR